MEMFEPSISLNMTALLPAAAEILWLKLKWTALKWGMWQNTTMLRGNYWK